MTTEKNKAPTETTDEKPKESFKLVIWLSFGFIVTFVLGYLGFLVYVSWPISEWSVSKAASLGDSFGILSSLFSGLAFAGLIVTIVMQNKTLKAQMEELELARKEYKRQGDELAGQKEVMNSQFQSIQLQQFETTFFKMIDNHRSIISLYELKISEENKGEVSFNGFEYVNKFYTDGFNVKAFIKEEESRRSFYKIYYCGFVRIFSLVVKNKELLESNGLKDFYVDVFKDYLSLADFNCLILLTYKYSIKSQENVFYDSIFEKEEFFSDIDIDKFYNAIRGDFSLIHDQGIFYFFISFLCKIKSKKNGFYNNSLIKLLVRFEDDCSSIINFVKKDLLVMNNKLDIRRNFMEEISELSLTEMNEIELSEFDSCVKTGQTKIFYDYLPIRDVYSYKGGVELLAKYFVSAKNNIQDIDTKIKYNKSQIDYATVMLKKLSDMRKSIPLTPLES
ncbi:hypothetical protein [Marinomonas sp. ef1]|uniref:hypothetical protein n=1 Tax=Marinomonas sp. ef1 TaxID=2005043 RepID=UPI000C292F5F|nr:hypothetical protein [Marinomonas sp. ef1]